MAKDELFSFMVRCMLQVGTRPSHAEVLAENLTMADYRGERPIISFRFVCRIRFSLGHYSHGLNRLDMYVNDIKSGTTAKEGSIICLFDDFKFD